LSEDVFTQGSTVTRTFRFDKAYESFLIEEAKKRGTSVNSLVEQIFRKYMLIYRFIGVPFSMTMSSDHLRLAIEALSEDEITRIFQEKGESYFISILSRIGAPLDKSSLLILIELGEIAGWFKAEVVRQGDSQIYYLRHELGEKWGFYLKTAFQTFFRDILEVDQKVEQYDGFILFNIGNKIIAKK